MEEAAGHKPVQLSFGHEGPVEAEVEDQRAAGVEKPPLPVATSARKAAALSAIRMKVAGALANSARLTDAPHVTRVRWLAHSGQRIPTGVGVMQSGQIGRPQDEQETAVSRFGWR